MLGRIGSRRVGIDTRGHKDGHNVTDTKRIESLWVEVLAHAEKLLKRKLKNDSRSQDGSGHEPIHSEVQCRSQRGEHIA
jgi:hypothetical protein